MRLGRDRDISCGSSLCHVACADYTGGSPHQQVSLVTANYDRVYSVHASIRVQPVLKKFVGDQTAVTVSREIASLHHWRE